MKHAIARLFPLLLTLTLFTTAAHADEETVTHRGIVYRKKTENQLTITGFLKRGQYVGIYEITRHVTINRQEYTVINLSGLHDLPNAQYVDSLAVPEFEPDLILLSDLRKFSGLSYLKISAAALGSYKDYRLVAKHLTQQQPVALDFFTFPVWATMRDGVHYTSDGATLLYTGTLEKRTKGNLFYLDDGLKRIAPYAIGYVNSTLFLILPPSIQSISASQIWRDDRAKSGRTGLENIDEGDFRNIYLFINHCLTSSLPDNFIEPSIETHDPDYELKLMFAIDPVGEALRLHTAKWTWGHPIAWRCISAIPARGKVDLRDARLKLTFCSTFEDNYNKVYRWNPCNSLTTSTITQDTLLAPWPGSPSHFEISPMPLPNKRFLGFIRNGHDTIRTTKSICWGIDDITLTPIYVDKDLYVEGFDFRLSKDRKTLKWWRNQPNDKDIAHLNIPTVTRCGENFLHEPPSSGSYTFPLQLSCIGPRAISNIPNLRELVIDHDLTLEKSALAGCAGILLIKLLNDTPLPVNAIRDAFFPDPVPKHLTLFIPKEHADAWDGVKNNLGAPLVTYDNPIVLVNRRKKEASMRVLWKKTLFDPKWHESLTDSIALPCLSLFKVDFSPLPAYDFDSLCLIENNIPFNYHDTLFATRSLALSPQCHFVRYPVRFSPPANGSIKVSLKANGTPLDSGNRVGRATEVEMLATPNAHYQFAHFSVNGQMISENPYTKATRSPLDIFAFFKPICYPITLDSQNECRWEVLDSEGLPVHYEEDAEGVQTFDLLCDNQKYSFRPIVEEGRTIDRLAINGKASRCQDTTIIVNGPITLCATTRMKTCFISIPDPELHANLLLQQSSGAPVAPNSRIPWGETLTIIANINQRNFAFDNISVNGTLYRRKEVSITADRDTISIGLNATPINFTVYVEPDYRIETRITSPMPMYDSLQDAGYWGVIPDQPIEISLNAIPGWTVTSLQLQWEGFDKETSLGARKECSVKSNLIVTPTLSQTFYKLSLPAKKKAGAVIAYDTQLKEIKPSTKLLYGDYITILPQAAKGFELKSLTINGTVVPPQQTSILVTRNILVSAYFDKISYSKSDTLVIDNKHTLHFASNYRGDTINFGETPALRSVTTIAAEAFAYNHTLVKAIITGNVSTIESRAFYNCSSLQQVIIGTNVRYVGAQAFADADKLEVIDILQNDPNLLTIDPAIFQKTRGVNPRYVFRVPNDAVEAFRTHPKWQHITVVPRTVEWLFLLESSGLQLNIDILDFSQQRHLSITQGQNVVTIPGGAYVAIESALSAPLIVTRIAINGGSTSLPCTYRALNCLSVSVLEQKPNTQKSTGIPTATRNAALVNIAPNPTTSSVTILPRTSSPLRFTLFSPIGVPITEGKLHNGAPAVLNMNNLEAGVYTIRTRNDKEIQTLLIIKI